MRLFDKIPEIPDQKQPEKQPDKPSDNSPSAMLLAKKSEQQPEGPLHMADQSNKLRIDYILNKQQPEGPFHMADQSNKKPVITHPCVAARLKWLRTFALKSPIRKKRAGTTRFPEFGNDFDKSFYPFHCPICPKGCRSRTGLTLHMKIHDKPSQFERVKLLP